MARTRGQQRNPAFLLNVRQATITENNLVTVPHLCVQGSETQQQSLGCPSFKESSMTKCSSLLIPAQDLQAELVVIRVFTDVHVEVISTLVCKNRALSLRGSRPLNMLQAFFIQMVWMTLYTW